MGSSLKSIDFRVAAEIPCFTQVSLLVCDGIMKSRKGCLHALIVFLFTRYYPSKDVDGAIIRPLPKVKHALSDAMNLPHIVQLLLTFDPVLVEKVGARNNMDGWEW